MSQKIQFFLVICIAIASAAILVDSQKPQPPTLQEITVIQPEERSITVFGTGEIKARPDTVEFTIIIKTDNRELAAARLENEEIFLELMGILGDYSIEKNDIVSEPPRVYIDTVSGKVYRTLVNKMTRVTLRDLAVMDALFIDLQQAEIGEIQNIVFTISKIDLYRQQALQLAIKTAEEKARAGALGIHREIGQTISIRENSDIYPSSGTSYSEFSTYSTGDDRTYPNNQFASYYELIIRSSVTVTFELK